MGASPGTAPPDHRHPRNAPADHAAGSDHVDQPGRRAQTGLLYFAAGFQDLVEELDLPPHRLPPQLLDRLLSRSNRQTGRDFQFMGSRPFGVPRAAPVTVSYLDPMQAVDRHRGHFLLSLGNPNFGKSAVCRAHDEVGPHIVGLAKQFIDVGAAVGYVREALGIAQQGCG